jgi:hypothetical protein
MIEPISCIPGIPAKNKDLPDPPKEIRRFFCIACGRSARYASDLCNHGFCDPCNTIENHKILKMGHVWGKG